MLNYWIANELNMLYDLTDLTQQGFTQLIERFREAYERPARAGRRPRLETPEDRLLFILFYFKVYPTQEALAGLFGFSQTSANHWIHRLTPVLEQVSGYKGGYISPLPRKPANIQILLAQYSFLEGFIRVIPES